MWLAIAASGSGAGLLAQSRFLGIAWSIPKKTIEARRTGHGRKDIAHGRRTHEGAAAPPKSATGARLRRAGLADATCAAEPAPAATAAAVQRARRGGWVRTGSTAIRSQAVEQGDPARRDRPYIAAIPAGRRAGDPQRARLPIRASRRAEISVAEADSLAARPCRCSMRRLRAAVRRKLARRGQDCRARRTLTGRSPVEIVGRPTASRKGDEIWIADFKTARRSRRCRTRMSANSRSIAPPRRCYIRAAGCAPSSCGRLTRAPRGRESAELDAALARV